MTVLGARHRGQPGFVMRVGPDSQIRVCTDDPFIALCQTRGMARSVLIVDDHIGFRAWARQLLETTGYRISGEAADGHEAIRVSRRTRPDVVLLDVHLPDIDGFEVTRRLIDTETSPPQIVLISSRDPVDFGGRISESGAVGFIGKEDLSAETLSNLLLGSS